MRVRSAPEIFSTLDERGALDGLPFMPEMLRYCGRRFPVFKRADKTCAGDGQPRRMHDTVHLGNVRCDGSSHGGCQAACLMHWKEAWLQRVEPGREGERGRTATSDEPDTRQAEFVRDTLLPATVDRREATRAEPAYRCQATEIPRATTRLRLRHVDQYARDLRNWGLPKILRGLAIEAFNLFQKASGRFLPRWLRVYGGREYPAIDGRLDKAQTPSARLDLQPGDLVRVKSKEEITATLDGTNHNRGLSFEKEMIKYCGRTARVRGRVERLIDERTGKLIRLKSDCIILEGVVCAADYHLFCTRSIYPYWREVWLERVAVPETQVGAAKPPFCPGRGEAAGVASRLAR